MKHLYLIPFGCPRLPHYCIWCVKQSVEIESFVILAWSLSNCHIPGKHNGFTSWNRAGIRFALKPWSKQEGAATTALPLAVSEDLFLVLHYCWLFNISLSKPQGGRWCVVSKVSCLQIISCQTYRLEICQDCNLLHIFAYDPRKVKSNKLTRLPLRPREQEIEHPIEAENFAFVLAKGWA